MKYDLLKESIQDSVTQEFQRQLNGGGEEKIDESLAVFATIAAGAAAAATWAKIVKMIRDAKNNKALKAFIETYDRENLIDDKLPELLRRFKLIQNLQDLDMMEKRVDGYINKLKSLYGDVDKFVDQYYEEQSSTGRSSDRRIKKDKDQIKNFIRNFIKNAEEAFSAEARAKKNDVLDR